MCLSNIWMDPLALFTSKLIRDRVLTMTCLKKIEFADMNSSLTLFLRTLLRDILKEDNDTERNAHFALISGKEWLQYLTCFHLTIFLENKKSAGCLLKTKWQMKICIFTGIQIFSSIIMFFFSISHFVFIRRHSVLEQI